MLRLLLDEQINPEVAAQMGVQFPHVEMTTLHVWEDRRYLQTDDAVILVEVYRQGYTLVTYDARTIVPLLKVWGESGIDHGGVIFVKASTIAPDNVGGLMRALAAVWEHYGDADWTNATMYLVP
jgi:predicted nuclease of predicted toxin-antitoxin system